MPPLVLVVATTRNRCIGLNGQMPWPRPPDGKHFVAVTTGHAVIMGRKTWDSIGRPLPNRRNLVVSRNPALVLPGAEVFASVPVAIAAARTADAEPRVIGGGELYRQSLPLATTVFLTELPEEFAGDTWFPELGSEWHETSTDDQGRFIIRRFDRQTQR